MEAVLALLFLLAPLVGLIWLGRLVRARSREIKSLTERLHTVARWRAHPYLEAGAPPPPLDSLGPPTEADAARLSGDLEHDIARLSAARAEMAELDHRCSRARVQANSLSEEVSALQANLGATREELSRASGELERVRAEITRGGATITSREFGFREPTYDCISADGYRRELAELRRDQKKAAADRSAVQYTAYTLNGSTAEGEKMATQMIKLIVRAFNNECEALTHKVTFKNLESIEAKIERAFTELNELNRINNVSLTRKYLDMKKRELYLVHRYHQQKEAEREEMRRQREAAREERAREKEIESKKKLVDKDITHHEQMISTLRAQLDRAAAEADAEVARRVQAEMDTLKATIEVKRQEKDELDHTLLSARAGYVYIISNVGAFGEGVVKIGVTRRLEPLERIKELSSASVPFPFDVHALVFSEDAFELEAQLHRHFDAQRVNLVNQRKEFFRVDMDQVRAKLDEYRDLVVDFTAEAPADEYRESLARALSA